jgi:rhodanese-related sulfurtransferase
MTYIKKSLIIQSLCFPLLFALAGCWGKKAAEPQKTLYVINVLEQAMYDDCAIKGSVNVQLSEVESFVKDLKKDTEIVIYCSNYLCSASGQVAKKLKKMGFTRVWAYEGGMAEWYQRGFPVNGECGQAYLQKQMDKPAQEELSEFEVITAQELLEKMKAHGLL